MAQWSGASESGILRKSKPKENFEELLVFGYACKLFRDDDKASYIDKGKHLIPWMGDEKLKIDRYDCRGALSDLRSYESSREGFDAMRWLGLNETDRKLEELCDKERYYSLHINEEEEQMYKEEEIKRKQTNAIQYSYDVPMNPETATAVPTVPEAEEIEEEYIPPPTLDVPVDIEIPKTVKENTRIEKTASFVSKQGPQMEILIKAKQSDNPQFSFLNQGDPLYKFYRHVLSALKSGRYQTQLERKAAEKLEDDKIVELENPGGHYLHPSLLSTSLQSDNQSSSSTFPIPAVPYKPSANCTYSQLVNRIQGNQNEVPPTIEPPKQVDVPANYSQMTYEQQQYYQYYYANQYYEYCKQMQQYSGKSEANVQVAPPPDFQLEPTVQNYIQQMAYAQYLQHQQQTTNPYAQIVSNVNKDSNPYTANVPTLPPVTKEERTVTYEKPIVVKTEESGAAVILKKPLLSLAAYGTDSEDEEEQQDIREVYLEPKGETQTVIDKMALYVAKNGEEFEEIVKAKADPRFEFLHTHHEYNKYYREKIKELKQGEAKDDKVLEKERKEKKVIAPVSFSIKKPKEDQQKEIKSALPLEESDEEAEKEVEASPVNVCLSENGTDSVEADVKDVEEEKNGIDLDNDDPILEMIDLTDDAEERKDARRAEDKIKDKLAAAAREKLASVSRDRQLQLERKKRAAAFLKLKSSESTNENCEDGESEVKKRATFDESKQSSTRNDELPSRNNDKSNSRDISRDKENCSSGKKDIVHIDDSDSERESSKSSKRSKESRRKKSHKRRHSKSRHDSRHDSSRSKKKSKKRRRRSDSTSSNSSAKS